MKELIETFPVKIYTSHAREMDAIKRLFMTLQWHVKRIVCTNSMSDSIMVFKNEPIKINSRDYWEIIIWCGTPKARNKIPNFQNPKAFILEGLDKN